MLGAMVLGCMHAEQPSVPAALRFPSVYGPVLTSVSAICFLHHAMEPQIANWCSRDQARCALESARCMRLQAAQRCAGGDGMDTRVSVKTIESSGRQ